MTPECCPCCYIDTYEFYSEREPDGQQLEPDRGNCITCGFQYSQHAEHPESKQVESHRKAMWADKEKFEQDLQRATEKYQKKIKPLRKNVDDLCKILRRIVLCDAGLQE